MMQENKAAKTMKDIPALYEEYKAAAKDSMHPQIDLMKFIEVHKRGIDFYNSYGLGDYKKEGKGLTRRMSRSQNRENDQRNKDGQLNEEVRKRHNSTELNNFDVAPLAEESEQPAPEEKTFKGTFKYYVEKPSIKVEDRDNNEEKKMAESLNQP